MTGRPDLRLVDGSAPEDLVVRQRRFEQAHPEVVILPPTAAGEHGAGGVETAQPFGGDRAARLGRHAGAAVESATFPAR
jgi:hypothetical protein